MKAFLNKLLKDQRGSKELVVGLLLLAIVGIPAVIFLAGRTNSTADTTRERLDEAIFNDTVFGEYD